MVWGTFKITALKALPIAHVSHVQLEGLIDSFKDD